jgi:hypothetical protein
MSLLHRSALFPTCATGRRRLGTRATSPPDEVRTSSHVCSEHLPDRRMGLRPSSPGLPFDRLTALSNPAGAGASKRPRPDRPVSACLPCPAQAGKTGLVATSTWSHRWFRRVRCSEVPYAGGQDARAPRPATSRSLSVGLNCTGRPGTRGSGGSRDAPRPREATGLEQQGLRDRADPRFPVRAGGAIAAPVLISARGQSTVLDVLWHRPRDQIRDPRGRGRSMRGYVQCQVIPGTDGQAAAQGP